MRGRLTGAIIGGTIAGSGRFAEGGASSSRSLRVATRVGLVSTKNGERAEVAATQWFLPSGLSH